MKTAGSETLCVHVPFTLRKRGGRKVIELPSGVSAPRRTVDNTIIKALARAFRWKRILESGEFTTIAELAAKEGLAVSYLARVLRMAQLAPDIVEAILEGRQPSEMTLTVLLEPFPMEWGEQWALPAFKRAIF
jgi:hypothetical protein